MCIGVTPILELHLSPDLPSIFEDVTFRATKKTKTNKSMIFFEALIFVQLFIKKKLI